MNVFLNNCKFINQYFVTKKPKFNAETRPKERYIAIENTEFWIGLSQTEFSLKLELLKEIIGLLNTNNDCTYSINVNKPI